MTPTCCVLAPTGMFPAVTAVTTAHLGSSSPAAAHSGQCTWCLSPAITYCESDKVLLCKSCDVRLHTSGLVASRHLRRIPCQSCFGRGAALRCRDCPRGYYCEQCHDAIVAAVPTPGVCDPRDSRDLPPAHQTTPVRLLAPLPALPQDLLSDDPFMADALTCADIAAAAAGGPVAAHCREEQEEEEEDGGCTAAAAAAHSASGFAHVPSSSGGVGSTSTSSVTVAVVARQRPAAPRVAGKWRGGISVTAAVLAAAAAAAATAATADEEAAGSEEQPEPPEENEPEAEARVEDEGQEAGEDAEMEDCAAALPPAAAAAAATTTACAMAEAAAGTGAAGDGHDPQEVEILVPLCRVPSSSAGDGGLCAACRGGVPPFDAEEAEPAELRAAAVEREATRGEDGSSGGCQWQQGGMAACPRTACLVCAAALPARCRRALSSVGSDDHDDAEMEQCDVAIEKEEEEALAAAAASAGGRRGGAGASSAPALGIGDRLVPVWGHAKAAVVAGRELERGTAAACACFGKWCGYVSALRDGQLTSIGHAALQHRHGAAAAAGAAVTTEPTTEADAGLGCEAEAFSRQGSFSTSVQEAQQALQLQELLADDHTPPPLPPAGGPYEQQLLSLMAGAVQQLAQHHQALPLAVATAPPVPPLAAVAPAAEAAGAEAGVEAGDADMFAGMAGLSEQEQRRMLLQQLEELRQQEQARLQHMHWLQQQQQQQQALHMHHQVHMHQVHMQLMACTPHAQQLHPQPQEPMQQPMQPAAHATDMDMNNDGTRHGGSASLTPPAPWPHVQMLPQQAPMPPEPQQQSQPFGTLPMQPGPPPYPVQLYQQHLAEQYEAPFSYTAEAGICRPEVPPLPPRQQQPPQPQLQQHAPSTRRMSEADSTSPLASSAIAGVPATPSTPSDAAPPAPPTPATMAAAAAAAAPAPPAKPAPVVTAARAPVQHPQQGSLLHRAPSLNGGIRKPPPPPPVITVIKRGPDGSILHKCCAPPPAVRRSVNGKPEDVPAATGARAAAPVVAVDIKATEVAESTSAAAVPTSAFSTTRAAVAAVAPGAAPQQQRNTPAYAPVTTPQATAYAAQVLAAAAAAAAGAGASGVRELTREERVARFREKRKRRNFDKVIRYATRKYYAEVRPRIRGRFARREEIEAWKMAHGGPDVEVPAVLDDD